jgi:hypothetical protein
MHRFQSHVPILPWWSWWTSTTQRHEFRFSRDNSMVCPMPDYFVPLYSWGIRKSLLLVSMFPFLLLRFCQEFWCWSTFFPANGARLMHFLQQITLCYVNGPLLKPSHSAAFIVLHLQWNTAYYTFPEQPFRIEQGGYIKLYMHRMSERITCKK